MGLQACNRVGGARARRGLWRRFEGRASLHDRGRCRARSSCSRGSRRAISVARSPPQPASSSRAPPARLIATPVGGSTRRPPETVTAAPSTGSLLDVHLHCNALRRLRIFHVAHVGRAPGHDGYPLRRNIARESPEPWRSPARTGRRSRSGGSDSTLLARCAGADTNLRRVAIVSGLPAASA